MPAGADSRTGIVAQGSKDEMLAQSGTIVRPLEVGALDKALADAGLSSKGFADRY